MEKLSKKEIALHYLVKLIENGSSVYGSLENYDEDPSVISKKLFLAIEAVEVKKKVIYYAVVYWSKIPSTMQRDMAPFSIWNRASLPPTATTAFPSS